MSKTAELNTLQIGNTTYYITSVFRGSVQLQHLIKRLIQEEIQQKKYCLIDKETVQEMAENAMKMWYTYKVQSSLFAVGKEQRC